MPRRCSVFGCRSNYDSETERTTTFSLPSDESRRALWLRNIPTDLTKLKRPNICVKHFDESCVIQVDIIMDRGQLKEFPRIIPKLTENAVPTIFPNTPSNCSKSTTKVRRLADVEDYHLKKAIQDSIESNNLHLQQNSLSCLNDISVFLEGQKICSNKWSVIRDDEKLHICLLGLDRGIPCVTAFITVNSDLSFRVNVSEGIHFAVNASINDVKKLTSINVLENVMSMVEKGEILPSVTDKINCAVNCLQTIPNYDENAQLKFIVEQLHVSQISKKQQTLWQQHHDSGMLLVCTFCQCIQCLEEM
ncbi:uncharacterized protein LOC126185140 [Schistocerca cancellata]|uniref:uncharacterized protein LOC126185140 n=1 Tax=Schistocerca cancellata TaxID=274614 RepID=UPI00211805B0|nr:uncharacterized protein LOC126185140 [Schistocerca cancellata]